VSVVTQYVHINSVIQKEAYLHCFDKFFSRISINIFLFIFMDMFPDLNVPVHSMEAYWESGGMAPHVGILGTTCDWSSCSPVISPPGSDPVLLVELEVGWAPEPFWMLSN